MGFPDRGRGCVGWFSGITVSVPPPLSGFDAIYLKVGRAVEHLETLKASLLTVIEGNIDTGILIEADADQWRAVVNLPDAERIDPRWSLRIGEILYQLRSSLDHIINAIVPASTKDTSFPIRDSEPSFDNDTARQLEGIDIGTMDWAVTKELQPFRLNPQAPRDTTAWAMNELANLDRHRFLHTSGLWLTESSRVIFDPPGGGTIDFSMGLPGPLEHGAVIASGRLIRTPDQPEVTVKVFGVPDLVLESVAAFRGTPDLLGIKASGLLVMIGFVSEVLAAYEDPVAFLHRIGQPG
jgi:hypothetical protein